MRFSGAVSWAKNDASRNSLAIGRRTEARDRRSMPHNATGSKQRTIHLGATLDF